jgi:intraflagellar transport protein 81
MRDVVHGDKRTVQHILHWMITKLPELQRKAYTAKFLVPLAIPDEFLVDRLSSEPLTRTLSRLEVNQ